VLGSWLPSDPIDGLIQHELGATDNDITSRLLADITVMMVILEVEPGQMAFLGYRMMSQNKTSHTGY